VKSLWVKAPAATSQFASQLALTSSDVGLAANRLQVSVTGLFPAPPSEFGDPWPAGEEAGVLAGCPLPCRVCCLEGPQRLYFFLIPRAYSVMIRSLDLSRRVWPLRTICGSKGRAAITRHRQVHRPDVGQDRLGSAAAAITAAPPGRVVLLIAQVPGHLVGQRLLQHGSWSPGTAGHRAEQLRPGIFLYLLRSSPQYETVVERVEIAWRSRGEELLRR
jgi:hypothetical protein